MNEQSTAFEEGVAMFIDAYIAAAPHLHAQVQAVSEVRRTLALEWPPEDVQRAGQKACAIIVAMQQREGATVS